MDIGREHELEELLRGQVAPRWHPQETITSRLVHWGIKQKKFCFIA